MMIYAIVVSFMILFRVEFDGRWDCFEFLNVVLIVRVVEFLVVFFSALFQRSDL